MAKKQRPKQINEGRVIELYKKEHSLAEIAEKYNTYPNKILRILKKHGIPRRTNSESQKVAIERGRKDAPNDGSPLTDEMKMAISEGMAKHWENVDEDFRTTHKERASEQWNNKSAEEKEALQRKARKGILLAAKNGSKLEVAIREFLTKNGILFYRNKKGILSNAEMEIDIFIPEYSVALEVDGIYHLQAIHDEDSFQRRKQADREKNALAIREGFWVVRVRVMRKNPSSKNYRDLCTDLLKLMKNLPEERIVINLDITDDGIVSSIELEEEENE